MNDVELETIKIRLEGIRQAVTRSRFTFLVSTIASVAIFVTTWNAYYSWDATFVSQPYWSEDKQFTATERAKRAKEIKESLALDPETLKEEGLEPDKELNGKIDTKDLTQVTDHAQKELVSEWIKSQFVTVGLLGIRVGVDDLPVLGSLSLFIISIWFFYSTRRENRAIGTLLRDVYQLEDWHVRYMIYQGIVHNLVLIDFGRGNKPIEDYTQEESDEASTPFLNSVVKALFYLAPFSIMFAILTDLLTLIWLPATLRPSHKPLGENILANIDWVEEIISIIFLLSTIYLCRGVSKFTRATEGLLRKYRKKLREELSEQQVND